MQYTFRNAELRFNDKSILADSVNFSLNAPIEGVFREGEKNSYDFAPVNGNDNSLSISFLLTGSCVLKDYIDLETGSISGYFGGLYFQSGYLTSYSFNANPNQPISVNANLKFFEPLTGNFVPSENTATDYKILNIADVSVTGTSLGSLDDIDSVSYSFNQNIVPQYIIGETKPRKILFESKEISMNINGAHITGNLPPQGIWADYQITLQHPEISSLSEVYFVNGKIMNRSIETSAGNEIKTSLTIKQNYTKKRPIITSISRSTIYAGQQLNIYGRNLLNVEKVLFCINGETIPRKEAAFTIGSDTAIRVVAPAGVSRGPIELRP